jgi:hypothetical protein
MLEPSLTLLSLRTPPTNSTTRITRTNSEHHRKRSNARFWPGGRKKHPPDLTHAQSAGHSRFITRFHCPILLFPRSYPKQSPPNKQKDSGPLGGQKGGRCSHGLMLIRPLSYNPKQPVRPTTCYPDILCPAATSKKKRQRSSQIGGNKKHRRSILAGCLSHLTQTPSVELPSSLPKKSRKKRRCPS